MIPPPPCSPLFPYTTLFRSEQHGNLRSDQAVVEFRDNHIARATVTGKPAEFEQQRTDSGRSEEHTSELQSLAYLVCRLLLEKKKPRCASTGPTSPSRRRTRP